MAHVMLCILQKVFYSQGDLFMNSKQHSRISKLLAVSGILTVSLLSHTAYADKGLVETLTQTNLNETALLKSAGVEIGGWADGGVSYNAHNPADNNNTPVTFNDRHGEFHLNQLNLFVKRGITEGDKWDFGFRVDFMGGTDTRFTQATGLDDKIINPNDSRFYDVAIPQFYVQAYAPILKGITMTAGHFYTLIGKEVVTSPDNFFYSHAYTMQYGEPFTHTGVTFSTPLTDNFKLTAGAVMGWDNFKRNSGIWSFLGGLNWTSDSKATSVAITGIHGEIDKNRPGDDRWLYSLVIDHDVIEGLHYTLQHDHGHETVHGGQNAEWYGVNQYLTYKLNDQVGLGLRGEWFRDDDGVRTGVAGNYYAVSAGVNWNPLSWLKVRPEMRYDWFKGQNSVYNGGQHKDQFMLATDFVVTF